MNREEALAYLSVDSEEEAEDAYEMRLFEVKQQVLTKPVLWKTTEAKINRLKQLQEASEVFLPKTESFAYAQYMFRLPDNLLDRLSIYNQWRNELKQQLSQVSHVPAMIHFLQELLELERLFVRPFSDYHNWCEESVSIGVEPDAMQLLTRLKTQSDLGRKTVEALYQHKNSLPIELLLVLKRLSLLKKYLYP